MVVGDARHMTMERVTLEDHILIFSLGRFQPQPLAHPGERSAQMAIPNRRRGARPTLAPPIPPPLVAHAALLLQLAGVMLFMSFVRLLPFVLVILLVGRELQLRGPPPLRVRGAVPQVP